MAILLHRWSRQTIWRNDHHLPPVGEPGSLSIRMYSSVPLLSVNGSTWATVRDLLRKGLLDTLPSPQDWVFVPNREVLTDQAIVFAVVQPTGLSESAVAFMLTDILDTRLPPDALATGVKPLANAHLSECFLHHPSPALEELAIGSEEALGCCLSLCREMDRAKRRLLRNHGGRILRAVQPLPGFPSPAWSRLRSLMRLTFACKPTLSRACGRNGRESYPRLPSRQYGVLFHRYLLGGVAMRQRRRDQDTTALKGAAQIVGKPGERGRVDALSHLHRLGWWTHRSQTLANGGRCGGTPVTIRGWQGRFHHRHFAQIAGGAGRGAALGG